MRQVYIVGIIVLSALLAFMLYNTSLKKKSSDQISFEIEEWNRQLAQLDEQRDEGNEDIILGAPDEVAEPMVMIPETSLNEFIDVAKDCLKPKASSIYSLESVIGIISTIAGLLSLIVALKQEKRASKELAT